MLKNSMVLNKKKKKKKKKKHHSMLVNNKLTYLTSQKYIPREIQLGTRGQNTQKHMFILAESFIVDPESLFRCKKWAGE